MFTGIIEEIGRISSVSANSVAILCCKVLEDINIGDSIAVDGVCLTVTSFDSSGFVADISEETKKVTKLSRLKTGELVNLERAMLVSSRLGGHIVSGHIDCVGEVVSIQRTGEFFELSVKFASSGFSKYFVKKGSVAVDGISLTIADLTDDSVRVAVIPHTFENTNMHTYKAGDFVNIEFDILAKYVEKNLLINDNKSKITEDFLKVNGFV